MKNLKTKSTVNNSSLEAMEALAQERGFNSRIWGTVLQWKNINRVVKQGETGTQIIKPVEKQMVNQDGKKLERLISRRYTIFNLDQTKAL
jgi:antirestriction protein ArdC